ncbi:MAG: hypothetical protein IJG97_01230 [Bacilli bacterium]|nr:hypothetical protein [Bacilli bacterium]
MNRKILKNIFDNLEQSLYSDMSIRIEHNLEDGKYREYLVTKVLQKIIPSKYSITNGFIIDSDNNISQEMDVIIYDKNYVPPFFDETYTVVPIEAVIAVIQVKTTLKSDTLNDSIKNLNSIDKLNSKTGGKIISANGTLITEKRYIKPYKIIIAYQTTYTDSHDFSNIMKDIDMLYIVEKNKILFIKDRNKIESVVCEKLETMEKAQKDYSVRKITESRLAFFALNLLEKMKLINNSIIINYEEYIKGAE